jgi:tetratricopeptide (TPR) repeat protein
VAPAPASIPSFGDLELDLPEIAADLPAASKPKAPPPKGAPATRETPDRGGLDPSDLPVVAAFALPAVAAHLPVPATGLSVSNDPLSTRAAGLPTHAPSLPTHAPSLPKALDSLPAARRFGELDLPAFAESLPAVPPLEKHLPVTAPVADLGAFGEIELPQEHSSSRSPAPQAASEEFGELDFDAGAHASSNGEAGTPSVGAPGGMGFGEVDLGASDAQVLDTAAHAEPNGTSSPAAMSWAPPAAEAAPAPPRAAPGRGVAEPRRAAGRAKQALGRAVALGVLACALVGGAALQLTPSGAFGYFAISDLVRAGEYARTTQSAIGTSEHTLAADTYDAAKSAVDAAYGAHLRLPRARSLTAYAAWIDYATTLHFGPDTGRASHGKALLAELSSDEPSPYREMASAAQLAAGGDIASARRALGAVHLDAKDPARAELVLAQGDLALLAGDAPAAVASFSQALALAKDARALYGLARAAEAGGDASEAAKQVDATLSLSPAHPGALTMRARRLGAAAEWAGALADLTSVLDGPARAKASPAELSRAYAARAWVLLERGAAALAREAFGQAVKLDPSNVEALHGEGRLLLNEGRYAEALARLDTALKLAPNSPAIIANDAEAKLLLERLEDAKQQLLAAQAKFPKSIPVLLVLAKVEQHLGNADAAEADLRAAIAAVDPSRLDAVQPYVALCKLESSRGKADSARATLEEAKARLPPSSALERALGDVSEAEGDVQTAIARYRAAISMDPKDVAAHFHLGAALRKVGRFEESAAELDKVAAVDADYPGLVLERGLLFEDSGDVEHAIEQFKSALAKAPEDPDLQLRVGSAYVAIDRPDDALPMLKKVLEKRPVSAEANHYIGRALLLKGGVLQADALHYLKRAVELDPGRAEFHVYLAWAANDATPAQLELARDEIDRALGLDKLNADAYWQRGVLERMEGAVDDAVKDEKHALELRPSRYEAHATLAECLEDKNQDAAAMGEWTKALGAEARTAAGDPMAHPYWHYRYGKLLMDQGGPAAALAQLLPAAAAAEKMEIRPGWLVPLEFLTAEALRIARRRAEAAEHYRRFLEIAPVNSPDRYDAQRALAALTGAGR